MSGLSRTLWGRTFPGLGWAGMFAAQAAVGGRTVRIGLGALDLTAVWAVRCMDGRGGGVEVTEHTTEDDRNTNEEKSSTKSCFQVNSVWVFAFTLLNNRSRCSGWGGFSYRCRFGDLCCRRNWAGGFVHQKDRSVITLRRRLEHPKTDKSAQKRIKTSIQKHLSFTRRLNESFLFPKISSPS